MALIRKPRGWLVGWLAGCLAGQLFVCVLAVCSTVCLAGWLVGCEYIWLVAWLFGWLKGWLVGQQTIDDEEGWNPDTEQEDVDKKQEKEERIYGSAQADVSP
ncbi:hypothetical protein LSH36_30g05022 [Paralvinella palmiformis]|uniref:Uncharacterized protein n=1 Tax=Paralvinella palmiformis TaxID=53620 RepID=A0AAD9KB81_9ANNE|nr:hypothetical protein LSH36_30g05022 [Paralvinella palmiformis]